jgi:hypothetical protein
MADRNLTGQGIEVDFFWQAGRCLAWTGLAHRPQPGAGPDRGWSPSDRRKFSRQRSTSRRTTDRRPARRRACQRADRHECGRVRDSCVPGPVDDVCAGLGRGG